MLEIFLQGIIDHPLAANTSVVHAFLLWPETMRAPVAARVSPQGLQPWSTAASASSDRPAFESLCGDRWAANWTSFYAGGDGRFAISAEEDLGLATALGSLARLGLADARRLVVTRGGSNYVYPPDGDAPRVGIASWFFHSPSHVDEADALENLFRVGESLTRHLSRKA